MLTAFTNLIKPQYRSQKGSICKDAMDNQKKDKTDMDTSVSTWKCYEMVRHFHELIS